MNWRREEGAISQSRQSNKTLVVIFAPNMKLRKPISFLDPRPHPFALLIAEIRLAVTAHLTGSHH